MNNGMPPPQYPQPQPPQQPQYPYPGQYQAPQNSKGKFSINPSTIIIVVMTLLFVIAGSFGVWSYTKYMQKKTDVDGQIAAAKAGAIKDQADKDAANFAEKEKEPDHTFVGPDDYGRVTFDYPKTWSVYDATDVSNGGTFQAYLNPVVVPPIGGANQLYALRVTIEQTDTSDVLQSYSGQVTAGQLTSSAVTINGVQGTRLDGEFDQNTRGAAVIFKIRDKTLTIRTDSNTFMPDFNNLIKTIKFNQ